MTNKIKNIFENARFFEENEQKNSQTYNLKNFFMKKSNNILLQNGNHLSPEEWAEKQKQQKQLEEQKKEKIQILEKKLGKTAIEISNRPSINTIDINNIDSIYKFSALQNLACAFGCCGNTTPASRVDELCDIFLEKGNKENIHFVIYPDPKWEQIKKEDPEEALEYFQVYQKNEIQNISEKNKIFDEFKEIFNSIKQ